MMISKFGYKKTALIGLVVGIIGILIQWMSGHVGRESAFVVYLIGAFISGLTMCILNCVVNPMLNLLGGGGNKGNQLIQIGGVFNSAAAVAVYIIMGALIGDAAKASISDATPALMIMLGDYFRGYVACAFIVILFTKIEEPEQAPVDLSLIKGAVKYRHFVLGTLGIFLYMCIEVGTPTYILQYLTAAPDAATPGLGMDAGIVGQIVAVYWLMMLVGRFVGGLIGGKVSSRAQVTVLASVVILFVLIGMFASTDTLVPIVGFEGSTGSFTTSQVPMGILFLVLGGLCTSIMWGGIFNMAVEGLGKYTEFASGMFMTMVFGGAILVPFQGLVADITGSFLSSYVVVLCCAAYILFYALIGSRVSKKAE